ncbi:MAG: biliverdin-producing heme oxygenase [Actinomycetes bacterium]
MASRGRRPPPEIRGAEDVLRMLRAGTAAEHAELERSLDLLDPALDRPRLTGVLSRMQGFWRAAEAGLDEWAVRSPDDARRVSWERRRRSDLFAADLAALGARVVESAPDRPAPGGTDEALGRLYVLEGSTLGGVFIDRHLAALPGLTGLRLRAFSPYGVETGAMWHAFRSVTRARVAAGGDPATMVAAARQTFGALAGWCCSADTRVPA